MYFPCKKTQKNITIVSIKYCLSICSFKSPNKVDSFDEQLQYLIFRWLRGNLKVVYGQMSKAPSSKPREPVSSSTSQSRLAMFNLHGLFNCGDRLVLLVQKMND